MLHHAREQCVILRRSRPEAGIPSAYRHLWGDLLSVSVARHPFAPWWQRPIPSDPDIVRDVFTQLRPYMHPAAVSRVPLPGIWLSLLRDLLMLPASTDPLLWLRKERSVSSAHIAIVAVLRQCRPRRDTLSPTGPTRYVTPRLAGMCTSRGILVVVKRLAFNDIESLVHLVAYFSLRRIVPHPSMSTTTPSWSGFTEISDDQEHYYLPELVESTGGTHVWGWKQDLTLSLYPALPLTVRRLTFKQQPVTIDVFDYALRESNAIALAGHLTWRVAVPG